jgi:D-glycero-alpha-D-manno-heptose-7-phosphate kinase
MAINCHQSSFIRQLTNSPFFVKNLLMIVRAKAPLRLGLAGGGTDVSPYSDIYGGNILNVTINQYAYATIQPRDDGKIYLESLDRNESVLLDIDKQLPFNRELDLLKGIYNRIVQEFTHQPLSFSCILM